MKNLFLKSLEFIKEYPTIIFSLILVVVIPAAFFVNTYTTTNGFEKNVDKITQSNAVMAENLIKSIASEKINEPEALQASVDEIMKENEKMEELSILIPNGDHDSFHTIASNKKENVGTDSNNIQDLLAWREPEGIAFLSQNENGRFWKVTKSITDPSGTKLALISTSFSLKDTDQLISSAINKAYVILIITILAVILLVSNQARLFGYALTLSKLKEIDKMKDTFISMASHDLRTPLTAIKGYLEFLKEKQDKNKNIEEDSKHYMNNIIISVDRLEALVNDILEVSRLQGNRLPIEIKSIDPSPLIAQSVEELRSQAMMKKLELIFQPGPQALIEADEERLKQVLINLISNAIKYTKEGSVTVSAKTKEKEYLITVADTGFGISSEDQAKLFQKFQRIYNENTKHITGTGLGLWITHEIIQRMNGKITLESIEGVGSHFTVHLPLSKK